MFVSLAEGVLIQRLRHPKPGSMQRIEKRPDGRDVSILLCSNDQPNRSDDGKSQIGGLLPSRRVVQDDVGSVPFASQCNHFRLTGIHGPAKQPHQRTARRTGAVKSSRHTAVLVAHSRGDSNVVVEGPE